MTTLTIDEAAFKILTEKTLKECQEEWENVWHNGTITEFADIDYNNEKEFNYYSLCLSDYISDNLDILENEIKDKFDIDFTIYSHGRSGATFYPKEYCTYHKFSTTALNEERVTGCDDMDDIEYCGLTWLEIKKQTENFLAALKFFNEEIHFYASGIKDWWKEERKYLIEERILNDED